MINLYNANLLAAAFILYAVAGILSWVSLAQTSGCSVRTTDRWPRGTTVYYSISGFALPQQQQAFDQIVSGIGKWNTANASNNSQVKFLPADANHSATYQFVAGTTSGVNGRFGHTSFTTNGSGGVTTAKTTFYLTGTFSDGTSIYDSSADGYDSIFLKVTLHEMGHPMGLDHPVPVSGQTACDQTDGATVMNVFCGPNDRQNNVPTAIQDCDKQNIDANYATPTPTPVPTFTPAPTPNACVQRYGERKDCNVCHNTLLDDDSDDEVDFEDFGCLTSPILVDVDGDGFDLTGVFGGVRFDLDSDGTTEQLAWTRTNSDDSFLVLDRNGDGVINSGAELFGDVTEQPELPPGEDRNGFLALAVFDDFANGGNGDAQIDPRDSIFSSLRLWRDTNHNGISEPNELKRLPKTPIRVFELEYAESRLTDLHGNKFRYRARVRDVFGAQVGRWAWDVFLVARP